MDPFRVTRHAAVAVLLAGTLALTACGAARPERPAGDPPRVSATAVAVPSLSVPTDVTAVSSAVAAAPRPRVSTPCDTNARDRYVFVSLHRQHMWLCAKRRVALATAITTGMTGPDTATPTGRYQIQSRNRDSVLTLNTGATYPVKYWIPFDAPLFGFHDSSWQNFPYGSAKYRTEGSHGCVHMPLAAIRYLYNWAAVGTPVRIAA